MDCPNSDVPKTYDRDGLRQFNNRKHKPCENVVNILKQHTIYQNKPLPCKPTLKILIINFRSVVNKREILVATLDEHRPDLVIGSETWLKPEIKNSELLFADYDIYRNDRDVCQGGGVMIAVKKNIISSPIQNPDKGEVTFCKVENGNNPPIIIGAVYRPPDSGVDTSVSICETLRNTVSQYKTSPFLIGGDFNLPDIDWKNGTSRNLKNTVEINEMYLEMSADLNLHQVIDQNTRENSLLDLLFTNLPNKIENVEVTAGISDHDIPKAEFKINVPRHKKPKRKVLLWKHADISHMKKEMDNFRRYFVKNHSKDTNIDKMWQCTKTNILMIVNENVPTKMTPAKESKPWINSEIKRLLRSKKKLHKRFKNNPTEKNAERYKEIKKLAQQKCRKAHSDYVNNLINDDSNNHKSLWTYVKTKNTENTGVSNLVDSNGLSVQNPKDKAELLNSQFCSVFVDPSGDSNGKLSGQKYGSMEHIEISEAGIRKLLENLDEHKATGPDEVSAKILKTFATEIAPVYTLLFQASLEQGVVPNDWKKANITPIFKKGDKSRPENYRPVSITSISCKVLEHIIHTNIMDHFDQHQVLTDVQHGFRKGRSCESQLITACSDFIETINSEGQTDAILLDFSKAFDKVHHASLIRKLEHYGISNKTLSWIHSFLTNRSQRVLVDNSMSTEQPVMSGVPQGTVLGPLLFLAYINDMPERLSPETNIRLFADDSLVYKEIKTEADGQILQDDLDKLQEWEKEWKMEFHPKKCQVIRITNKLKVHSNEYLIHGHTLELKSKAEYLGVTLDDKMNWNSHIDKIVCKANKTLGFLRRNLSECNKNVKEKCYKTFVRPILEYSCCVWDPETQSSIEKLEKVQRRACRFVCNNYGKQNSVTQMMDGLGWEPLKERRRRQKMKTLHKGRENQLAIPMDTLRRHGRNKNAYVMPFSRVNSHKQSFFPSTVRLWNALPDKIRGEKDLATFQKYVENNPIQKRQFIE